MKLLVNDKELANYLTSLIDIREFINDIPYPNTHVTDAMGYALVERRKGVDNWRKKKDKIKDKIRTGVEKDLKTYFNNVTLHLKDKKEIYYKSIHKNINLILDRLGQNTVLKNYANSKSITGFIKSTGFCIDKTASLVRRHGFNNVDEDCLLRNTVGNEQFLVNKIDKKLPFWFIDSGYTNFIESNKKWHRLVKNHLHYGNFIDAPVDRLGMFKTFPQQWRTGGEKILIIEPGPFAASIFHVDVNAWRHSVEKELRQYTDKLIVFREKTNKKIRKSLYKELCDNDYYCVVSINSNAATESIWAGIPVITLDTHISNPGSRNKLSDIDNLYKGSLSQWLSMVSYSQFTYNELIDGTAVNIVRNYHV